MLYNPQNQLLGSKANNHVEIRITMMAVCEDRANRTRSAFSHAQPLSSIADSYADVQSPIEQIWFCCSLPKDTGS
jgi:hypothetical protein